MIPYGSTLAIGGPSVEKITCTGKYTATYTSSGASGTVTYTITAGPDQVGISNTTGIFQLTPGGTYTVQAKDNCGTTSSTTNTIDIINMFGAAWGAEGGDCLTSGSLGAATSLVAGGGVFPYTATLTNNCGGPNPGPISFTYGGYYNYGNVSGLARPCTYTYTITDACGTQVTQTVNFVGPGAGNLYTSNGIICPDPNDPTNKYIAVIDVGYGPPYNPKPNFTFTIKDSNGNLAAGSPITQAGYELRVSLAPGNYTYVVTDDCGTTGTGTITVAGYIPPTLTVDATNACIGAGQAKLIGTSNNVAYDARHDYTIIAGPDRVGEANTTGVFSNLASGGTYTFEFFDGCKRVTKTVTIPPYKQATFEVTLGVLCGGTTACIQAFNASGGLLPLKYEIISLNTTGGLTRPVQSDSLFCGLGVGQYNVRGFDACENSFTYLGKIGALVKPVIDIKPKYCIGETIRLRATQCVYGATYTWYRDGVVIYTGPKHFINLANATPAMSGTYTVKVSVPNPGGAPCEEISDGVVVIVAPTLIITNPAKVCGGTGSVDLTAAAITAGSDAGTLSYWTDANATTALTNPSAVTTGGTYYIKIVTADGCTTIKPVVVTIAANPTVTVATGGKLTCVATSVTLSATGSPATVTYSWTGAGITSGATTATPTVNAYFQFVVSYECNLLRCNNSYSNGECCWYLYSNSNRPIEWLYQHRHCNSNPRCYETNSNSDRW